MTNSNAEARAVCLVERAISILSKPSLAERYEGEIEWLSGRQKLWGAGKVRIGVLGVTSSGKSTLINAVLGRELLSSAGQPTSSRLVSCAKGAAPQAVISFTEESGKSEKILEGKNLSKENLQIYSDERYNRGNKEKVKDIKIITPEFEFGDDVELVDSAGLDAYKLEEHEKLSMEVLLPTIDMCVFVTTLKSNSDAKAKEVLDAVAKHDCPLVIVQNMLDSVAPKPDGSKTKSEVAGEHKKRLERIIERSAVKDKNSVKIAQMSALYAQSSRCHGIAEEQMSHYGEFCSLMKEMIDASLPLINRGRLNSLSERWSALISSEEKKLAGKKGAGDTFRFEGRKEELDDNLIKFSGALRAEIEKLSKSGSLSISRAKENVKQCESDIFKHISRFNDYIKSAAGKLGVPRRDITVEVKTASLSEPREFYKTETTTTKKRVKSTRGPFGGNVARFFGDWFNTDWGYEYVDEVSTRTVLDEARTAEELNNYIARARKTYAETIRGALSGFEASIEKLKKEIDNLRKSWKERQAEIKSEDDVRDAMEELKKITPKKKSAGGIDIEFAQKIQEEKFTIKVSPYQKNIFELSKILLQKIFQTIIRSALKAANAPQNIVIAGWDAECLQSFVFRFFGEGAAPALKNIESSKKAKHKEFTALFSPDERSLRAARDKKESAFFILVNAQQDGSAKNQISKLKLNEVLSGKDKVFFVVEDFQSIIHSKTILEMRGNMEDYFKEFTAGENKGFLLINDGNPLFSLAYLENQISPCTGQADEIEIMNLFEKGGLKFLYKNNEKIIGDILRTM